jgi:succinate dehydrogenase / fumarate reductase cytochrome b subunit
MATARRPVFFNLLRIQLPVGALTSITHRITGLILVSGLPLGAYVLDLSLRSAEGYSRVVAIFHALPARIAAVALAWALAHHMLAGVRHLLSDVDVGSGLSASRRSAWCVNVAGLAVAAFAAGALL